MDAWGSLNGIGHYNVDGSDGTVTILQAPEFLSDVEHPGAQTLEINADIYNVPPVDFDSMSIFFPFFHAPTAGSRSARFSIISGNEDGTFGINSVTGEIFIATGPVPLTVNRELKIRVEDAVYPLLYDEATVRLKAASVAMAQAAIAQVYWECRSWGETWWIGTNTCERFANLFEQRLRELRARDENVLIAASNYTIVTYTLSGIISPTSPKHAAVRIEFIDGTELFYDNGSFDGIYTEHPDWATPDF